MRIDKITGKRVKRAWREAKKETDSLEFISLKEFSRRRATHTSDARVWLDRKAGLTP